MTDEPNPRPPRLPDGAAAYRRDRLGFVVRVARECGQVWQLRRGVYVAATVEHCQTVLRGTTHEYAAFSGTFPPPVRTTRGRTAAGSPRERVRPRRPHAGAQPSGGDRPARRDRPRDPGLRHRLARIGGRYLFGPDAARLRAAGDGLATAREDLLRGPYWPAWLPTAPRRAIRRHRARFSHEPQQVIDRRRARGDLGDDLLGHMLRHCPRHGPLPDPAIRDSLTGLIVASSETPTRAAGWLLLALARHPDAADRVAAEAAALPENPHEITRAHLDHLPCTRALVHEVLRPHPPNWLLARRATEHTELAGYPVAPGTTVLVCPYTADSRERSDVGDHSDSGDQDPLAELLCVDLPRRSRRVDLLADVLRRVPLGPGRRRG